MNYDLKQRERESDRQRDRWRKRKINESVFFLNCIWEIEKQRDRKIQETERDREMMTVICLKVCLGDSNRQPQPSRENLEYYRQRDRGMERGERDRIIDRVRI